MFEVDSGASAVRVFDEDDGSKLFVASGSQGTLMKRGAGERTLHAVRTPRFIPLWVSNDAYRVGVGVVFLELTLSLSMSDGCECDSGVSAYRGARCSTAAPCASLCAPERRRHSSSRR